MTVEKDHEIFSRLTPQQLRVLDLLVYGFRPEEIDPHFKYLENNSAESLITELSVVPESWTLNGFGRDNPPLVPEDWEKVYKTSYKDETVSDEELKKAALRGANFMSTEGKQIWRRSS